MIKYLAWDSDFLSLKVGQLVHGKGVFNSLEINSSYDLLYVFADQKIQFPDPFMKDYSVQLVDEKVTYGKTLTLEQVTSRPNSSIQSVPIDFIPDVHFEELAIQSGVYSRFFIDKKFPKDKFRELYKQWLHRSIGRVFADEVLVYLHKEQIVGFITYKFKSDAYEIGLVAVDHQFRGMGIGSQLLQAVDFFTKSENTPIGIRVVTQASNTSACRLYEKAGFQLTLHQYIYHCWKN
ncbi:GNAT family N-acetyltransferase [Mongoliitalea lutea]|uniref:N-acetyltransferase domain-containing protein n=1 Tax=Mongoliitalea lutea TaxID=849756 RepID=A0A8J3G587_9BACT|nr:GNAT family N-acetyltransferase [Mongoliitalea lutea]GHB37024.1 hypothetical protein GCM10008106_17880 [Mongoliitalea lutea]